MKKLVTVIMAVVLIASAAQASIESKTWPASDKAKKFVKDTVVIGFFASPYGTGWTKDEHLHDYLQRSRDAGITGHDMTLAAGSYTWDQYLNELQIWRNTMAQTPGKYIYGGNKMRVYQQVWEGVSPEQHKTDLKERYRLREKLRQRWQSR